MCHIAASKDIDKLKHLAVLGLYRGNRAFSHTQFLYDSENPDGVASHVTCNITQRIASPLSDFKHLSKFIAAKQSYHIIHTQAPTSSLSPEEKDYPSHPAKASDDDGRVLYLWHNGIIRNVGDKWDTLELANRILTQGWSALANVEGSFACIALDEMRRVSIFRNEISPLFVDDELNLCSVPFEGCREVPHSEVFMLDFLRNKMIPCYSFKNSESPYFIPE